MSELQITFRLKDIRKACGISQNELARLCNMSVTNIQKYERGEMKSVPFDTLAMFCQILNSEPADFFQKQKP